MSNDVYNLALNELKKYNKEAGIDLHIPSIGRAVVFKPLTVKQQTSIITGTLTAASAENTNAYAYQDTIDKVILENCDPSEISNLSSVDRMCILIQLRLITIGDTMDIQGETYSITDHVSTFSDITIDIQSVDCDREYEGIKCTCKVPTFVEDTEANKEAAEVFRETTARDAMGDLFLIELTKYIYAINFSGEAIDFTELTFKQKIQICEMLPMGLSQKIIDYIEIIRSLEKPFTQMTGNDGEVIDIPIDDQLFSK